MVKCEICSIEHDLGPLNLNGAGKRILVSSFPKTGTNFIIQFLGRNVGHIKISHSMLYAGIPIKSNTSDKHSGEFLSLQDMVVQLQDFSGSAFGHIPYTYSFLEAINSKPTTMLMMIRDPRDVITSHYHYVMGRPHVAMNYVFMDDETRLSERPDPVLDLIRLSVPRWKMFLPWIESGAHPIRYEDLLNKTRDVCQQIIDLVGEDYEDLDLQDPEAMMNRAKDRHSPTFRKGVVGDWTSLFQDHHIKAYEDSGMLEIERELGYGR